MGLQVGKGGGGIEQDAWLGKSSELRFLCVLPRDFRWCCDLGRNESRSLALLGRGGNIFFERGLVVAGERRLPFFLFSGDAQSIRLIAVTMGNKLNRSYGFPLCRENEYFPSPIAGMLSYQISREGSGIGCCPKQKPIRTSPIVQTHGSLIFLSVKSLVRSESPFQLSPGNPFPGT